MLCKVCFFLLKLVRIKFIFKVKYEKILLECILVVLLKEIFFFCRLVILIFINILLKVFCVFELFIIG